MTDYARYERRCRLVAEVLAFALLGAGVLAGIFC